MACPALATETAFSTALARTAAHRIGGDTLRLLDAANVPLARLVAVYVR